MNRYLLDLAKRAGIENASIDEHGALHWPLYNEETDRAATAFVQFNAYTSKWECFIMPEIEEDTSGDGTYDTPEEAVRVTAVYAKAWASAPCMKCEDGVVEVERDVWRGGGHDTVDASYACDCAAGKRKASAMQASREEGYERACDDAKWR